MLDRLIEQRKAVTLALSHATGPNVPTNLTANEWSTAKDLVVALKPFLDVTILMSSARYPTLSMILPVVDRLEDFLQHAEGRLDGLQQIFLEQI